MATEAMVLCSKRRDCTHSNCEALCAMLETASIHQAHPKLLTMASIIRTSSIPGLVVILKRV